MNQTFKVQNTQTYNIQDTRNASARG